MQSLAHSGFLDLGERLTLLWQEFPKRGKELLTSARLPTTDRRV